MPDNAQWGRKCGASTVLLCCGFFLIFLIVAADEQFKLYEHISNRARYHAIPVALSQLCYGRKHDYTGFKRISFQFQDMNADIHTLIEKFTDPSVDIGMKTANGELADEATAERETYYWAVDDKGLSDYVYLAFSIFGAQLHSLSKFYVLLLGCSFLLFCGGYWNNRLALVLGVLLIFSVLVLAHTYHFHSEAVMAGGSTGRQTIALYESRVFEVLSMLACLHLALLACWPREVSFLAWWTAAPQVALLVFLYHCRSSLGWQYLVLFCLAAAHALWWLLARLRGSSPGFFRGLRPVFVALLLAASIFGLMRYKRATYNPMYFAQSGSRTIWHNALMGLSYHPAIQQEIGLEIDDAVVMKVIIEWMKARRDGRLDDTWTVETILNSLGSHTRFDWPAYESAARELYFEIWRTRPGQMLACHMFYKPRSVLSQAKEITRFVLSGARKDFPASLLAGVLVCLLMLGGVVRSAVRSVEVRGDLCSVLKICAALTIFSLIPSLAFYASLQTMSGFFMLFGLCLFVLLALTAGCVRRLRSGNAAQPPAPQQSRLAA